MSSGNFNMEDPTVQERIRRGPHKYIPTAGKHGAYVAVQPKFEEYPKMMAKLPQPQLKDFLKVKGVAIPNDLALANYQQAMSEWDRAMTDSVVYNPEQEQRWLKENG
jgi:hypothetical protein